MDERSLAAKRLQYQRDLEESLSRIVEVLAYRPEVHQIILFGSYARGRRDLFTDLDLLIVMESPLDFVTRTAELYRDLSAPVDMDLLVYTPEELARNKDRGWMRQLLREGQVLYEKLTAPRGPSLAEAGR
jgi:predicted nucleotidyltransferase